MSLNTRIRGVQIKDADITATQLANDAVETLKIKDKNVTLAKLASGASAQLIVAGAEGVPAYQDVTGDVTISNAGVTTIGDTKVTGDMLNDSVATKLAGEGLTATNGVLSADAVADNIVEGDIKLENQSANCDGTVVAFTLSNTPLASSLDVYLNGLRQEEGEGKDFTVSETTVTFATAPAADDILIIRYIVDN
jgi:hypothetical protein